MTKPFIQELVNEMTLDEKLAQLTQLGPYYWGLDDTVDLTGPFKELKIKPHAIENIGSVLNGVGARNAIEMQTRHMQKAARRFRCSLWRMSSTATGPFCPFLWRWAAASIWKPVNALPSSLPKKAQLPGFMSRSRR